MKSLLSILATAAILASCGTDAPEYHYTLIDHPGAMVQVVEAVATTDSIVFVAFDDWSLETDCSWASLPSDPAMRSGKVPLNHYVRLSVPISFEANDTGKERMARVSLNSNGKTLQAVYVQQAAKASTEEEK